MNKIFKVIYSKSRHCYVVVSELAKSHCKSTQSTPAKSKKVLTAAVLLALVSLVPGMMPTAMALSTWRGGDLTAEGKNAAAAGGQSNHADGDYSTIIGGYSNRTGTKDAVVIGGYENTAAGLFGADGSTTWDNQPTAYTTVVGGKGNTALGFVASSFGGFLGITQGNWSTGVAGGSTDNQAALSLAAGYGSVVTNGGVKVVVDPKTQKQDYVNVSTALGYQATADEEGTISFGHDAGDVAGYYISTDWHYGDTTKAPKVSTKYHKDAYYNRLVKIADGINSHDAVTMDQMMNVDNSKAEVDANNIGRNYKVVQTDDGNVIYDEKTKLPVMVDASSEQKKANSSAWGQALGTGAVAKDNDQLVTGGTVYDAIQNIVPTTESIAGKANVSADNIGKNLKDEEGNAASDIDQKTNASKWGEAIGLGSVNADNNQLVTGGTVYNALQQQANDLNYNAGWGINIADENTGDGTVTKNAISVDRNLGSNEITTKSKNTFKAAGENSLILGGAGTDDLVYINGKPRETQFGAYGKDSVLVGGENNKITDTGTYAVISGGGQNIASGEHSFIGGGWWNTASGATSTVLGGQSNTASGKQSTIVGGEKHKAIGNESTILGGFQHTAIGDHSTISGGDGAYTFGTYSSVSGGQGNIAIGMASSADGGWLNYSYGDYSQTNGGYSNYTLGNASSSLGGRNGVVQGNVSVGIAGGSTEAGAGYALAAGYQSVVTAAGVHREKSNDPVDSYLEAGNDTGGNEGYKYTDVATALGYQATADAPNTVSFGHDKGDVSGYTVEWGYEFETDAQGNMKFDENGMPLVKAVKLNSITTNYYDTAKYNRLVKAADGIEDHDAVVMEQLKNASDVGSNIKVYKTDTNGNVLLDEDNKPIEDTSDAAKTKREAAQKASEDAWAAAIGTGNIEADNGQLVTGKTVHAYNKPVADSGKELTYVDVDKTTGQNLGVLDAQVKTNADAIGTNTKNITNNTNDITKLTNLSNITNEGQKVIKNLSKDAVKVEAGDRVTVTPTEDEEAGTITYKVSANNDGTVAAGDQNLVSGDTVNTAITNAINNAGTATDTKLAGKANVDASNIGSNIKVYKPGEGDESVLDEEATKQAQTDNANAWGRAIGTGKVADPTKSDTNDPTTNGSQQLVTGGEVYDALHGGLDDVILGHDGKDGQPGKDGSIGLVGPKGQDGKDGKTTTIIKTETGAAGVNGKDGKDGITRIVYGDKDNPDDKHTVATLDDGMKYAGDAGDAANVALNHQLKLSGTTFGEDKVHKSYDEKDWTSDNIAVVSDKVDKDGNAVMNLKLSKDLKGLNSSTYTSTETTGEEDQKQTTDYTTTVDSKGMTIQSKVTKDGKTEMVNGPSMTIDGIDGGGKQITNVGDGITKDKDGSYTISETDKKNAANIGDVQTIVNDAKKDLTDGTNGLNKKANVDATNIGSNIKVYKPGEGDESVLDEEATKQARTDNANSWGKAIGTGNIEENNGQLVTGGTIFKETRVSAKDSQGKDKVYRYISASNSAAGNLESLDTQVGHNADAIAENKAGIANNATNISNNTEAINEIKNNIGSLTDNAVQYDDSDKKQITLKGEGGTTITNVKGGAVTEGSTDAVNGGQLFDEQKARQKADDAINQKIGSLDKDGSYIHKDSSISDNLSNLDDQVGKNTKAIDDLQKSSSDISGKLDSKADKDLGNLSDEGKQVIKDTMKDDMDKKANVDASNIDASKWAEKLGTGNVTEGDKNLVNGDTVHNAIREAEGRNPVQSDGQTITIGRKDTATKIDVSGIDKNGNTTGRVITGIVSDANDPTSAANVGYVNEVTAANTQRIYRDMNNAYSRLDTNINKAAAGSNALAALHPLEFDPADKASFAVGYGHYHNANAAAIGAFYRPNVNTMVNLGVSLGNGDPGFNAGVSFKLGQGSAYNGVSKAEMAQTIQNQAAQISALEQANQKIEKENEEMKAQIQQILDRLNG